MDEARQRAHLAWRRVERIKQLSDGIVRIGPFGLGVDGVLAWVPAAGTLYSVGAAALLINEAVHAGASRATLIRMAAYLGLDSASSAIPLVGWAADTFFRAHAMSARALQKDIERRHGRPAEGQPVSDLENERSVRMNAGSYGTGRS
jgi:hypothetical protein